MRCTRSRGPRGFFCLQVIRRGPVNAAVIWLIQMLEKESEFIDLKRLMELYNNESPRGAAMTVSAHLDSLLGKILASYLSDSESSKKMLSGFGAPLGTFSSRIEMCSAICLIENNEHTELNIIRRIRNKFGHELESHDFDHPSVRDLVDKLPSLPGAHPNASRMACFLSASTVLAIDLMWRSHHVTKTRVTPKKWPSKVRDGSAKWTPAN